jgi:hypothetical protein
LRSHFPSFIDICACGIFRALAINIENVSSAVEIVFPLGVFITTIPRPVAASTSTLSTPTPARPTTRSCGAASITFRVTFVSLRTTIAATSLTTGINSSSFNRFSSTTTSNSFRCFSRSIPFGETGSQTKTFIVKERQSCEPASETSIRIPFATRDTHPANQLCRGTHSSSPSLGIDAQSPIL